MEKRRNRRYSKRFKVRFGLKEFTSTGFTNDVSATGMFVVTTSLLTIGQRVHAEVTMDEDLKLYFEGDVARLTLVAPELRQIMKGGFGLRFLSGTELMGEMVPHLKGKTRIVITYPTLHRFSNAYQTELRRGGCFVWTHSHYPVNSIVDLEIEAEFCNRSIAFECRVMHVVIGDDRRFGTALMFVDQASALAALAGLAGK
jgi:Tfp pilus assembly protein PilZ